MSTLKFDWQKQGGSLEIPDEWYVDGADFDTDEPYIHIQPEYDSPDLDFYPQGKVLRVPKSLAYYLSIHSCGSLTMRELMVMSGRLEVRNNIKKALGIK